MNTNKKQFTYGMLPPGTICEVFVLGVHKVPQTMVVARIQKNGPDSYVIESNVMTEHTGYESCNVCHVTRIIKRGPGIATIDRTWESKIKSSFFERENETNKMFGITKHKNKYATTRITKLVATLAFSINNDNMIINLEKLITMLEQRGVIPKPNFNSIESENEYYKVKFIQKKKLRKAIKQLLNKCLSVHKKRQQELNDAYDEMYRKEDEIEYGNL